MAKANGQKLKLLLLKQLLETNSDEAHPLSMEDLLAGLARSGVSAERKSVYDDLALLRDAYGLDIILARGRGYYIGTREFELPELKLLVDAVQSSKFLSERKSLTLIHKLEKLCSVHQARQLQRQVTVFGRVKTMNESIYYNVDKLHAAIAADRQVSFRYFDWGMDRQRHERLGLYTASPFALCWDDENYYLIAISARHGLTHYRVDKMTQLHLLDTPREPEPSLDLASYAKKTFGMFGGQTQTVRLRFDRRLAGVVIDRFGRDCAMTPEDAEHFVLTAEIAVSPVFLGWLLGFGSQVQVLSPDSLRAQVVDQCRQIAGQYE